MFAFFLYNICCSITRKVRWKNSAAHSRSSLGNVLYDCTAVPYNDVTRGSAIRASNTFGFCSARSRLAASLASSAYFLTCYARYMTEITTAAAPMISPIAPTASHSIDDPPTHLTSVDRIVTRHARSFLTLSSTTMHPAIPRCARQCVLRTLRSMG